MTRLVTFAAGLLFAALLAAFVAFHVSSALEAVNRGLVNPQGPFAQIERN
jgi:hypothetical protein